MDEVAERLRGVADGLAEAGRRAEAASREVVARDFGADSGGMPGRIGERLHSHLAAVLQARSREVADAARRVEALADEVSLSAHALADTDADVARRIRREG
jgi:hypothetical protein